MRLKQKQKKNDKKNVINQQNKQQTEEVTKDCKRIFSINKENKKKIIKQFEVMSIK